MKTALEKSESSRWRWVRSLRAELPVAPLRRLLWWRDGFWWETLEFEFDVYRNLKQAGVQNKLGEPMRKAIKETGDGAEQKNDSPFPSVVPGHCIWLTGIQDGLGKCSKCKWQWWYFRQLWAGAYLCILYVYTIRQCSIYLPLCPSLKFQKEFQILMFYIHIIFSKKIESFVYIEFLKAQSNLVRVDASPAKHKPSQTSIYNWKCPIKYRKPWRSVWRSFYQLCGIWPDLLLSFQYPLGSTVMQALEWRQSKSGLRMWNCGKLLEEKSVRSLSACGRAQARRPRSFHGDSGNLGRVTVSLSKPPPQPWPFISYNNKHRPAIEMITSPSFITHVWL